MNEKSLGQSIKTQRKFRKMTQAELAKQCGVSVLSIIRYEKDERSPSFDTLKKIAEVLHMNISSFLVFAPKEQIIDYKDDWMKYREEQLADSVPRKQMLEAFDKLNNAGKKIAAQRV